jgi:catechol 2,3-dioxygenase-like lactoylglutathione lyase family enzyme
MKLEVIVVPVSDVDRAKEFYASLGWRLDADFAGDDGYRVIQFTPPGSGASVIFGKNVTDAEPGSAQGLYLIVSDIEAARKDLRGRDVDISEVFQAGDVQAGDDEPYWFGRLRVGGADPERRSYRSYASFSDPDGTGWLFQEVTTRLPGRIDASATTFASAAGLLSETDFGHQTAAVAVAQGERGTNRGCKLMGDRKAKPRAPRVAVTRLLQAEEGVQDRFQLVVRNAGTAIEHSYKHSAVLALSLNVRTAGEFERIVDQVGEDTP